MACPEEETNVDMVHLPTWKDETRSKELLHTIIVHLINTLPFFSLKATDRHRLNMLINITFDELQVCDGFHKIMYDLRFSVLSVAGF